MGDWAALPGLALAANGKPVDFKILFIADGVAGFPKIKRVSPEGRGFNHPSDLAVVNFVTNLRRIIKIFATVVNAPTAVDRQQQAFFGIGDQIWQFPLAWSQHQVGHADDGGTIVAVGAHTTIAGLADLGRGLP